MKELIKDREACVPIFYAWFLTLHPAFISLAEMSQSLKTHTHLLVLFPICCYLSGELWGFPL